MKLFLTGFMGSGKSLIGALLAQELDLGFLDLDQQLELQEGLTVPAIFSLKGESYFREAEAACLRQMETLQKYIIATGGGTPCFHGNMDWMNENGITVFLDVPPETLADRLRMQAANRPLLQGQTGENLLPFIREKLAERKAIYENAQFVCHAKADVQVIVPILAGYFRRFVG